VLENLDGFININTISTLSIHNNPNLNSLTGLGNIIYVDRLSLSENDTLVAMDGLESLSGPYKYDKTRINIVKNNNLIDFCALNSIISGDKCIIETESNRYNPTVQDFISGNCRLE
jgi:hypothetical protein